jgi:hypothetical protein
MGTRGKLYSLAGGALAAEVVAYLLWRPRMLRWGATAEEAREPLPGDERTPHPRVQSTRAVTIDAPPEQVWPWLLQMGIGRGGFYTHDWVERLIAHARYVEGKHSATRIHPEVPPLQVGDTVPIAGNNTRLIVRYRGVGFVAPAAHAIRPDAGRLPRLIRFAILHVPGVDLALRGFDFFVSDPPHHYMETGMLTGIKARAEGTYSHAGNADPPDPAVEPVATEN